VVPSAGHLLGDLVADIYVGRVMPVVMDHHGLRVDMRLERVERVAERRQLERAVSRLALGQARSPA
jgi:hypothetical protein